MIYVLDFCCWDTSFDHQEYCLVVEADKSTKDMVEICTAVQFLAEDLFGTYNIPNYVLLKILTQYYGVLDIKHLFYKEELESLILPTRGAIKHNKITPKNCHRIDEVCVIDLTEVRNGLSGLFAKELYRKWMSQVEVFKDIQTIIAQEELKIQEEGGEIQQREIRRRKRDRDAKKKDLELQRFYQSILC